MWHRLVIIGLVSLLNACSTVNSGFDCPKTAGISCKPLHEVDALVSRGELGTQKPAPSKQTARHQNPLRVKQKRLAIWLAPFEDIDGTVHEASWVYAPLKVAQSDVMKGR